MSGTPIKRGKFWSISDTNKCMELYNAGKSFEEIAYELERTPLAIEYHVCRHIVLPIYLGMLDKYKISKNIIDNVIAYKNTNKDISINRDGAANAACCREDGAASKYITIKFNNETESESCIYVLALDNDKYYVGKTRNFQARYKDHLNSSMGALWTKIHKPIKIVEKIYYYDDYDEDKIVKKYMYKYGIDNVRGGSYVTERLSFITKKFIQHELWMANNRCAHCGGDHFIKQCKNKNWIVTFIMYLFKKIL